jgi:hypothetical protein
MKHQAPFSLFVNHHSQKVPARQSVKCTIHCLVVYQHNHQNVWVTLKLHVRPTVVTPLSQP